VIICIVSKNKCPNAKILRPTFYKYKGTVLGYGLKFWPYDFTLLKIQTPHLAGFADWLEKE
jgi:hypothetical protein